MPNCEVPSGLARPELELLALGDFVPTNDSAEVLPLEAVGSALPFPSGTRAVLAHVTSGAATLSGYGERHGTAGLDVLLWPDGATCSVWPSRRRAAYPGRGSGHALGYDPSLGLILMAGGDDPLSSDALVGALAFDVNSGHVRMLDTTTDGALREPRAFASVTPFAGGFVVAGGQRPVAGVNELELEVSATAEVFDSAQGRFVGEPIALLGNRTHHAAIALDDGRTLLIGGRSKFQSASIAQYQLEIVDPAQRRSVIGDALTPRIDPRVLRLSDGRIFVGGGTSSEGAPSEPVGEWLSAAGKLTSTRLSLKVAPRFERAFVALSGGGVLAVGGCEDRPPASDQDREACSAACTRGCPPLDGYDAWWIDENGEAARVTLPGIVASRPILLPGSDGSPWLIAANDSSPDQPQLFRFNPWSAQFEAVFVADSVQLPRPDRPQPVSFDVDSFAWPDDMAGHGSLLGLRLGSRSRFAQDLALVITTADDDPTRPAHLVPSGPPGDAVLYDGKLRLLSPEVSVQVADTDYADVSIELTLDSGAPPLVVLGSSVLGGSECPWPDGPQRGDAFDRPSVLRHDSHAELRFHGGKTSCQVAEGRLTLALRAGEHRSVVRRLDALRSVAER
ncbi:MAG TPA: hypothetical protein VHB79_15770 [Polyangiaceae bacterium]|nr:hypothetical protein [Polyangiaceae bacterium]